MGEGLLAPDALGEPGRPVAEGARSRGCADRSASAVLRLEGEAPDADPAQRRAELSRRSVMRDPSLGCHHGQASSRPAASAGAAGEELERGLRLGLLRPGERDAMLREVGAALGGDLEGLCRAGTSSRARGSASHPGRATSRRRAGARAAFGVKTVLRMNVGPERDEGVELEACRRVRRVERPLVLREELAEGQHAGDRVARTSWPVVRPLSDPEQTKPPGSASTSTLNDGSRRSSAGSSAGTTGRSLTTVSPAPPWIRRARTTTPAPLRARSGVSKKKTCRGFASTGSIGRPSDRRDAGRARGRSA